jgi:dolichol-phosphate mannosyltransferase
MKKVSVIIPAYNEERTLSRLLDRIQQVSTETVGYQKEIVVVDDGSSDRTAVIAEQHGVTCLKQTNQGKGAAIQNGIQMASGDCILIQDADLEYDPGDYPALLDALKAGDNTAVYGSRVLGQRKQRGRFSLGKHPEQDIGPWVANWILSVWTFLLYGQWISDPLTGYKLYPAGWLKSYRARTRGFETDHELTARLIKTGMRIVEVPVSYYPRTVSEGKKIQLSDAFVAIWTLLKFRFVN